jgi:DNA-binding response OmpR family regulator
MKRVLVVEDEQMLAQIIDIKLTEEAFEVSHAFDGDQAYAALNKEPAPDLVLMDVLLPKQNGFEVLERVKKEKGSLPPFMIFSNFGQDSDMKRAKELGAIDYIVKAAFSPVEIISKIKSVLQVED